MIVCIAHDRKYYCEAGCFKCMAEEAWRLKAENAALKAQLSQATAEAYDECAIEAMKDRIVLFTYDHVATMDDWLKIRAQMKKEIAEAISAKAAQMRGKG